MFSQHVMTKGLKTVDSDASPAKPEQFQLSLITEELLFMRIINNHKTTMFFLVLFHTSVITVCMFALLNGPQVVEESAICKNAYSIKNYTYVLLNSLIIYFAIRSIKRSRAVLANFNFYDRYNLLLLLGMLISLTLLLFKFFPDFFCKNITLSLPNTLLLTGHIFFENLILMFYVRWFNQELRTFGAMMEQHN